MNMLAWAKAKTHSQVILVIHEAYYWVLTLETAMAGIHGDIIVDGVLKVEPYVDSYC